MRTRTLTAGLAALALVPALPAARGAEPAETAEATRAAAPEDPGAASAAVGRTLTTASVPVRPAFAFWESADDDGFIKPVLQIASLLTFYVPHGDRDATLAWRASTLALARFGLEGQLFGFVSFRSVFERNVGFSLARNGPVGTSVWEGTASLQARENYVRFERWGLSLTGGIFPDPASVDYVTPAVLDAFGMDPYVRDPLLVTGFAQGQGVMLRYRWRGLSAGLSYTGGNPLVSSLAFGFGGNVSSLGTLFTAPLRALSNGLPGSDIQMGVVTPSLTFEHDVVDVAVAAQIYFVDVDVTIDDDKKLFGYNLRATARVKLLDERLRLYGAFALRRNEQLAVPDLTTKAADYEGLAVGAGADVTWDRLVAGVSYYWLDSTLNDVSGLTSQYLNVGVQWWLKPPYAAVALRYARSMADAEPTPPRLKATDSLIFSMMLLL